MTAPEELVWAAAFAAALASGKDKFEAAKCAQMAVQWLRELPGGGSTPQGPVQRMLQDFRSGGDGD